MGSGHWLAETALGLVALGLIAASVLSWLLVAARVAVASAWLPPAWRDALARVLVEAKLNPGLPLVPSLPRRPVPWAFFDLVALVGIWLIASAVVGGLFRQAGWLPVGADLDQGASVPGRAALAANIAVPLLAMAISLPLIALRTGATLCDLGLAPPQLVADVRTGLVAFVMLAPPVYGVQALLVALWKPSQHPLIDLFRRAPQLDVFLLLCLSAGLVAPLVEELLFRVLLQGFLEKVVVFRGPVHELVFGSLPPSAEPRATMSLFASDADAAPAVAVVDPSPLPPQHATDAALGGPMPAERAPAELPPSGWRGWLPVIFSATLFGLMHYSHGPDWIPLIGLGLGLGYLYQKTHRLVPCCVVHAALNGLSLWGLGVEVFR